MFATQSLEKSLSVTKTGFDSRFEIQTQPEIFQEIG